MSTAHPTIGQVRTTPGHVAVDGLGDVRPVYALRGTVAERARRFVPSFDPHSGGADSPLLVLMESPGPLTISAGSGAICSENSPGPTVADLDEGWNVLPELLRALPDLVAIVAFGTVALDGVMRHLPLDTTARLVTAIAAPHPSPANGRHRAEQHIRGANALHLAWNAAARSGGPS